MHIHFIGICGTFMAGLAKIAKSIGHEVSGSDRVFYPPMSDQIEAMDIVVFKGFDDETIWDEITPDLVIVGNVCSRGMPIIESMLSRKIAFTSGPQWLGSEVLSQKKVFAIAGTHGKTTTTAMLTHIFTYWDKTPSYLVGGVLSESPHSAQINDGKYFVIEADEYDSAYFDKRPKFMHYNPYVFAVGNAEFDHADIYEHVGQIKNQYHYGIRNVPPYGGVILGYGEHIDSIYGKGVWSHCIVAEKAYQIKNNNLIKNNEIISVFPTTIIGLHNQQNALMACLVASYAEISITQGLEALSTFKGVKRRLEKIYSSNQINVYDDFAHHPTAVEMTLTAMKEMINDQNLSKRLICVLESRSNTMKMGVHQKSLSSALKLADISYVYTSSDSGWDFSKNTKCYDEITQLVDDLTKNVMSGDEIVIMSNGDFDGIYTKIKDKLNDKYTS